MFLQRKRGGVVQNEANERKTAEKKNTFVGHTSWMKQCQNKCDMTQNDNKVPTEKMDNENR